MAVEPVGVGFSYADNGEVNNSPAAAEDVVAFLSLFLIQVCLCLVQEALVTKLRCSSSASTPNSTST